VESIWPVFRISHQRSRYIYDLFYRRKAISRELYDFCLDQGYADKNLIAKWKKQGYERLCCLRCIQSKDTNYGVRQALTPPSSSDVSFRAELVLHLRPCLHQLLNGLRSVDLACSSQHTAPSLYDSSSLVSIRSRPSPSQTNLCSRCVCAADCVHLPRAQKDAQRRSGCGVPALRVPRVCGGG
jgi:hypothetical protein